MSIQYLTSNPSATDDQKRVGEWDRTSPLSADRLNEIYQALLNNAGGKPKIWTSAEYFANDADAISSTGRVITHDLGDVPDYIYYDLIRQVAPTATDSENPYYALNERVRINSINNNNIYTKFSKTHVTVKYKANSSIWTLRRTPVNSNNADWKWQLTAIKF